MDRLEAGESTRSYRHTGLEEEQAGDVATQELVHSHPDFRIRNSCDRPWLFLERLGRRNLLRCSLASYCCPTRT